MLRFTLLLLLSLSVASDSSSDKPKPKPKPKPSDPVQGNGNGGYYETTDAPTATPSLPSDPFISFCHSTGPGTQCGTQGYKDLSYCSVDTSGETVCVADQNCDTISPSCTTNLDCATGQVCAELASPCTPSLVCHNLCGFLQAAPLVPDPASYYADTDAANNVCYGEADLLSDQLDMSSPSSSISPFLTPLNVVLASLAAVLLVIFSIQRISGGSSGEVKFNQLPTSSQHASPDTVL